MPDWPFRPARAPATCDCRSCCGSSRMACWQSWMAASHVARVNSTRQARFCAWASLSAAFGQCCNRERALSACAGLQSRIGMGQSAGGRIPCAWRQRSERRECADEQAARKPPARWREPCSPSESSPLNLDRHALLQGLAVGCAGSHPIAVLQAGENGHLGQIGSADGHLGALQFSCPRSCRRNTGRFRSAAPRAEC